MTEEHEGDQEVPMQSDIPDMPVADVIKSLIHYLANRPSHQSLWNLEDITAKGIYICLYFALIVKSHVLDTFNNLGNKTNI